VRIIILLVSVLLSGTLFYKKIYLPHDLHEVSGVCSLPDGRLLWLNDGGNKPYLYITDLQGKLDSVIKLPLRNRDWEEMTSDDDGNLYIGDFGNNANDRRDLIIYKLDPTYRVIDSILFNYEDQTLFPPPIVERRFDMEAMIWSDHRLHLFSKNKMGSNGISTHYMLSDTGRRQTAVKVEELELAPYIVSGAARKPGTNEVILLTYTYHFRLQFLPDSQTRLYRFQLDSATQRLLPQQSPYKVLPTWLASSQYEAIAWSGPEHLVIAAEGGKKRRPFFRIESK